MQVHCDEGIANHIGPRVMRRVPRGAWRSVDRGTHRPAIEPRKIKIPDADAVARVEGNTNRCATASACLVRRGLRPWHVRTLFVREPGDLASGQGRHVLALVRIGKARSRSR